MSTPWLIHNHKDEYNMAHIPVVHIHKVIYPDWNNNFILKNSNSILSISK